MHQCHNITIHGAISKRTQYGKDQRGRKDGKDKGGGKDREDERSGERYRENKVNLVVKKNSDFEASVYYHIIYKY